MIPLLILFAFAIVSFIFMGGIVFNDNRRRQKLRKDTDSEYWKG